MDGRDLHLGELGGSTAGDLLDAEGDELILQLIELLGEILLGLGPQLCCFNSGLRACESAPEFVASPFPPTPALISPNA